MNGFVATVPAARGSRLPTLEAGGPARRVERGGLVAVVDARLDAPEPLRAALGVGAGDDRRASDAAVVAAAFERWGEGAPDRLEGAFAAVVWDREARTALAVRDRLGLRPLFRAAGPDGGVLFASSLAALRARLAPALDAAHAAGFLAGDVGDGRTTFARGVERVPSATVVRVAPDGPPSERRYWQLDPGPTFVASDAETEGRFLDLFDASVEAALGDAPGAFLSGGLDSSSIVVTARQLRPDTRVPTFSITYDRPEARETRYLDAVVAQGGLDPHRVDGEALSLLDGLDDDLRAAGEPFAMPNLFLTRSLYAEARAAGVDAVLDGFAGDNVVGHGERRLAELAWALRLPTLAREVRAVTAASPRPRRAALDLVRDYVAAPLVAPMRRARPALSFAHPDLPFVAASPRAFRTDRATHAADLGSPLLAHAFEVAYAVAGAHGVEPRFPFASAPLVAFCLSLPSSQRMRDGVTRSVLRRALSGRLPDLVRDRHGKARLGTSFADALVVRGADRLRQIVHEDVPDASDVLDVAAVQAAHARAVADPAARGDLAVPLWRAAVVARWLALTR